MSGQAVVWVDGRLLPAGEPHIPVRDRGFTLGDGVFETVRVRESTLLNAGRHLSRLRASAEIIGIPVPLSDTQLLEAAHETLHANGLSEAALRITLSRGVQKARGLLPTPEASPTLVLDARSFDGYPEELYSRGMRAITSSIIRNERSPLAGAKTLSYLENVLARREAALEGADEALLLNTSGRVAGTSAANVFLVSGNLVRTPDLVSGALPGTMRALVLQELAPSLELDILEEPLTPEDLLAGTEAFLTNALLGVMPLTVVDRRPIGNGRPGPVTALLRQTVARWSSTQTSRAAPQPE